MNALTARKSTVTALCCLLLAILAVVWAASAGRETENNDSDSAVPAGNSFARFSSNSVEVFGENDETIYSVPFGFSDRVLTRSGETAAAWSALADEIVFLGEGGWKSVSTDSDILGVFGSDSGAVCAICETASGGMTVDVYGAAGLVCSFTAEGFFPLAAAISPCGDCLAVLCADGLGYSVRTYRAPSFEPEECGYLERAAYSLVWDGDGLRILYLE